MEVLLEASIVLLAVETQPSVIMLLFNVLVARVTPTHNENYAFLISNTSYFLGIYVAIL